mmetsp:Transcript_159740/g.512510  ORF Transcript_159740/g.512510 Transcript_159740/m.512510 type:complete len:331 (-) Transcript_159740:166-1158(-)
MVSETAKKVAFWAISTTIVWVTAVPLMLHADKSMGLFVVWLIIAACCCLCAGQMAVGRKLLDGGQRHETPRTLLPCTGCFTLAAILVYTLGQGSVWWLVKDDMIAHGCNLASDAKNFQKQGVLVVNCFDGYVPSAEQVARASAKVSRVSNHEAGSLKYDLVANVAPLYADASMSGPPVALAVRARWTLMGPSPDDVPSPGPDCGQWDKGGFCGFTADFLDSFTGGDKFGVRSNWGSMSTGDVTELAREAVRAQGQAWGTPETLSELPIFLANNPDEILSKSRSFFIAGFVLLPFGSTLFAIIAYLLSPVEEASAAQSPPQTGIQLEGGKT